LLLHGGQRIPVHIKGVMLAGANTLGEVVSLTVGLGEPAMSLAVAGDKIHA
jgi:hypothetical protein